MSHRQFNTDLQDKLKEVSMLSISSSIFQVATAVAWKWVLSPHAEVRAQQRGVVRERCRPPIQTQHFVKDAKDFFCNLQFKLPSRKLVCVDLF